MTFRWTTRHLTLTSLLILVALVVVLTTLATAHLGTTHVAAEGKPPSLFP